MKMNRTIIFFMLVFVIACSDKEIRKTYYPDGTVKEESEVVNGKRNGIAKSYQSDGIMIYEGKYKDDKRVGWHNYYSSKGKLRFKTLYLIVEDKELASKKITLDEQGNIEGEVSFSKKNLQISADKKVYYLGDTLRLSLKILDAKYPYCEAALGLLDENLNVLKYTGEPQFVQGNLEHKVSLNILLSKLGADTVTGLIRDYDLRHRNDSTDAVVGEDSFFSFPIDVQQSKEL